MRTVGLRAFYFRQYNISGRDDASRTAMHADQERKKNRDTDR